MYKCYRQYPYVLNRAAATAAATFVPFGGPLATELVGEGELNDVAVAFDSSDAPILAWTDAPVSGGDYGMGTTASRWDGTAWQSIGSAGVGPVFSGQTGQPSLAVTLSGKIFLAWTPTTVEEWVGQSWADATTGLPSLSLLNPSLTSLGEAVLLGCETQTTEGATLAVFLRDGGDWGSVGPSLPDATTGTPRVAIDGAGALYAAYESPASGGIHVLRRDSGGWQSLGADVLVGSPQLGLVGLLIDGAGEPVLAGLDGNAKLQVLRWSGLDWQSLGSPRPIAPPQAAGSIGSGLFRPQAALAAVPDGGISIIYALDQRSMQVDGWDGVDWQPVAGPLRGLSGAEQVFTPALAYDSTGRPLAAWQAVGQSQSSDVDVLLVWRP